jgi:acetyl-CoA synthetase
MKNQTIPKPTKSNAQKANLADYNTAYEKFDWEDIREHFIGCDGGETMNIAVASVETQIENGLGDKTALRWIKKDGTRHLVSYDDLSRQSNRFASVLSKLGISRGDVVFSLLGRIPELYITALGTWKFGAVFCPLFSAFGPEPAFSRMEIANAKVLVTTAKLYERKIAKIRDRLPNLQHVLLVDGGDDGLDLQALLADADPMYETHSTNHDDLAILHFTSGTTGKPKGVMHVHEAVITHHETARLALDLKEDDVFWCTADPGWVTGTSYGIIAPLTIGCTMLSDEQDFDAERWYKVLSEEKVTVWYTAPTAIRMLIRAGSELAKKYDLSNLRFIASVGEPLDPEAVIWGQEVLGLPIHDNWWQSETGGIMISNFASVPVKPGSMGKPLPGIEAAIVRYDDKKFELINDINTEGELALKSGWPSMFRGYLNQEERYNKCFRDGWYLTGDLARRDADGYYWFVGRADDMIKSAGHLIGPFEVESALIAHQAVAEAAVIGIPDPLIHEQVKAFVTLHRGYKPNDTLLKELMAHARKRLGPTVAPREIEFRDDLPKTRSGKIMRRLLKARELGLPEGDISTLERPSQ